MSDTKDGRELREIATVTRTAKDWIVAQEVDGRYGGRATRQNLHLVAAVVVVVIFAPDVFQNPTQPLSWLMALLAVGFALFIWKYPGHHNRTYANNRAEKTPEVTLSSAITGLLLKDAYGEDFFSLEEGLRVWDYQERLVLLGTGARLNVFPVMELDEEARAELRSLLHRQLGENYQKVEKLSERFGKR